MPKKVISVRNDELYLSDISVKATLDGSGNTWLAIEFLASSVDEHPPYTADEKKYYGEISLRNTGKGIASDSYRVKTTPNGGDTKFLIETKVNAKIPGTGPEVRTNGKK